jgi:internalin A
LVAAQWGCKLDMTKLALLVAFCRWAPLVGVAKDEDGKERMVILPKPSVVRLVEVGMTTGSVPLPIFELHGDGVPSVEHPVCELHHWHNAVVPARMGEVAAKEWKSDWLLDEANAEVRRILIEQIGYERICQELEAKKLDSWREYELLRIDNADVEPIMLCKMTCPSAGRIHALRVPPDVETAREAITVCNHGIDPEEFAAER